MPSNVQIYSPQGSTALNFVLDFVFDEFYGCGYEVVSDANNLNPDRAVINYSGDLIENALQIIPNNYLFASDLKDFPSVEFGLWKGLPVFFESDGTISFDLFAAIFFLLARVEEYSNPKRDAHNRFSAEFSLFNADFIQRPIIDEWLTELRRELIGHANLKLVERRFKWINTYDIDVAYAYRYRTIKHVIAATGRNILRGDLNSFFARFKVLFGGEKDPYDTYAFQKAISEKYADETIYFFLLGDRSKYDRNLPHYSQGMKSLIQYVQSYARSEVHPSYVSGERPAQLTVEIKRLSAITSKEVSAGRQHFLRLNLPSTYRDLIESGITQDYSMGYADMPGFRSGTCMPHYFFDLERKLKTTLRIFPLVVMEGSLRDYLKLEFAEAQTMINMLVNRVKAVDGTFISLWHNDSLADTQGNYWRELYLEMAKSLKSN